LPPSTKSKAFLGAYHKGKKAAIAGKSRSECPYADHRTKSGSVTFGRAFQRYWRLGFDEMAHSEPVDESGSPEKESLPEPEMHGV